MVQRFTKIGRETLEIADTAPLDLMRQVVEWQEDENEITGTFLWPDSKDEDTCRQAVKSSLDKQVPEFLHPIEDRCVRIRHLASIEGTKSLKHVAHERLTNEECEQFDTQPDELLSALIAHGTVWRDCVAEGLQLIFTPPYSWNAYAEGCVRLKAL